MAVKKIIFRYRIITNLNCNMNESTGPNGNCYFCYQPLKEPLQLDIKKCNHTMDQVGVLKRATIMGGESTLRNDLPDIIKMVKNHVTEDVCLVTNGILLNEERIKSYAEAGLTEVAISVSSLEQYYKRRNSALLCKSYIPNTRINIPKCKESTGDKLVELLKAILSDNFYVIVCEDLMGRYGDFDFQEKLGTSKVKDDNCNFYDYIWTDEKGNKHQFGVFGNYTGYDATDIIITPVGNFCHWEDYCKKVGNCSLCKKYSSADYEDLDIESLRDFIDSKPIRKKIS